MVRNSRWIFQWSTSNAIDKLNKYGIKRQIPLILPGSYHITNIKIIADSIFNLCLSSYSQNLDEFKIYKKNITPNQERDSIIYSIGGLPILHVFKAKDVVVNNNTCFNRKEIVSYKKLNSKEIISISQDKLTYIKKIQ